MIHIEPIVFTIRVFLKDKKWGEPYNGVCTVQKMDNVGFVSGYHGKLDKQSVLDLHDGLEQYGITELKWLRGRKHGNNI